MYNIKNAEFRRMSEYAGQPCAELEVTLDNEANPDLLVYVAKAPQAGGYEIVHMYSTNTAPELDWYNSHLNHSFEEIAEEDFGAFSAEADAASERQAFKEKLLSFASVKKKLEQNLG